MNILTSAAACGLSLAAVALATTPATASASPVSAPSLNLNLNRVDCWSWASGQDENHVAAQCTAKSTRAARGVGDCNGLQPDIFTAWIMGAGWSLSSSHCWNGVHGTHIES